MLVIPTQVAENSYVPLPWVVSYSISGLFILEDQQIDLYPKIPSHPAGQLLSPNTLIMIDCWELGSLPQSEFPSPEEGELSEVSLGNMHGKVGAGCIPFPKSHSDVDTIVNINFMVEMLLLMLQCYRLFGVWSVALHEPEGCLGGGTHLWYSFLQWICIIPQIQNCLTCVTCFTSMRWWSGRGALLSIWSPYGSIHILPCMKTEALFLGNLLVCAQFTGKHK